MFILRNILFTSFVKNAYLYDKKCPRSPKAFLLVISIGIEIINSISNSFEENLQELKKLLNASKALDFVGSNIVINKLKYYGVRVKLLVLIKSYTLNNKQG